MIAAVGIAALKILVCVISHARQLTAVARALDAQPIAIDPRVAAHRRAHAVQHVLGLVAVLIGEHRIGERLAVAGRSAIVHHQRRPAARRIHLILEVERRPLLAVRPAVDVDDQRVLRASVTPSGFVRNASTSNLLSFETNVNDSTSASRLPPSTAALRSVILRPAMYSCA